MTQDSVGMTEKLFDSLIVYRDVDSRSAASNMAIDEALLETTTEPTIRFYRWDHPALSFGYFGKFDDVASHSDKRDIVRRWTGGGIVFHGEDLTYSVVVPASVPAFAESSMSIYEKVHAAICRALTAKGEREVVCCDHAPMARPTNDYPPNNGPQGRGYNEDLCFANAVRFDVMLNGQKVAGAAQRRTRRGLLQQGSIQGIGLLADFETNFAEQLSDRFEEKTLQRRVLERAQEIAGQKYGTAAWLRRR